MHLYCPVGLREVERIAASGFHRFPPRTPDRPIFRATPARDAAEAIARDWHTRDDASGYAGFVMRFEVRDSLLDRYPLRAADDSGRRELRVPADELDELDRAIVGTIRVEASFAGPRFAGSLDPDSHLPANPTDARPAQRWLVWRRDDHGNRFEVSRGHSEAEARSIAAEYESRGHKQSYGAEPE